MNRIYPFVCAAIAVCLALGACSTAPKSAEGKADIVHDADAVLARAKGRDPSLADALNHSAGYAVFPKVGKGAAGVGGAYGKGVLYEHGNVVGYCDLTQASVGLQLGGQTYTQFVSFEDKAALDKFKHGDLAFDAQASAVALEAGAGANAKFREGVEVFTMNEEGMMVEASVGGQKFSYKPR